MRAIEVRSISTFYIKNSQINDEKIVVIGEDVNHIKNVLRYRIGDEIDVCDDNAIRYYTKILTMSNDEVVLEIQSKTFDTTESNIKIDLYQGLPKSDKMELIIQKVTELGASSVIPVITERVIVKIDEKSEAKKLERWNKIALEASKQSGRQVVPQIQKIMKLENFVENLSKYDIVIVPYECEKENTLKKVIKNYQKDVKSIAVVIGPEGGFSENDLKLLEKLPNMSKVSLGKRILRTETAGLATIAMLIYEYEL